MGLIKQTKNYTMTVETLPEDKLPQYVVRHNSHGVVEYADNTLLRAMQWMDECEKLMAKYMADEAVQPKPVSIQILN